MLFVGRLAFTRISSTLQFYAVFLDLRKHRNLFITAFGIDIDCFLHAKARPADEMRALSHNIADALQNLTLTDVKEAAPNISPVRLRFISLTYTQLLRSEIIHLETCESPCQPMHGKLEEGRCRVGEFGCL